MTYAPNTPTNPRFSRLLGTVLGSPFLTTTDLPDTPEDADPFSFYGSTSARPASPVPTMDFSIISPPGTPVSSYPNTQSPTHLSLNIQGLFGNMPGSLRLPSPSRSPGRRPSPSPTQSNSSRSGSRSGTRRTYFPAPTSTPSLGVFPNASDLTMAVESANGSVGSRRTPSPNPIKALLPRLWDALSSPGKNPSRLPSYSRSHSREPTPSRFRDKGKHKASASTTRYSKQNPDGEYDSDFSVNCSMMSHSELIPLDGEEGELVDDEACFIDVRAVTGIDILSLLPPELALHILAFLSLHGINACLGVSKTWRALAADNGVWRGLWSIKEREDGWRVDLSRVEALGAIEAARLGMSEHRETSVSEEGGPSTVGSGDLGRRRLVSTSTTGATINSESGHSSIFGGYGYGYAHGYGYASASSSGSGRWSEEAWSANLDHSIDGMSIDDTSIDDTRVGSFSGYSSYSPEPTSMLYSSTSTITRRYSTLPPLPLSDSPSSSPILPPFPSPLSLYTRPLPSLPPKSPLTHTSPPLINPALAPLMLDWRVLYKNRMELERRWEGKSLVGSPGVGIGAAQKQGSAAREPKVLRIGGHADSVYCLEFDSSRIITGSRDRTIKVWSLKTGKLLGTFGGHGGSVLCLKFDKDWERKGGSEMSGIENEDGEEMVGPGFMVSGSSDCSVCVWDLYIVKGKGSTEGDMDGEREVRAEVKTVLKGHSGGVLDLRIDDKWIVSCSKDALIRVYSRETLTLHTTLRGHEGPVNAVGLQSGRVVSASGDGKMMLWDIESGERIRTFEGHDRGLACIEFKDDLIVSGSNDCKIKLWSALTGECIRTLVGHDLLVRALSFDPKTGRLVSASYDKTVKVWDLRNGRMVREFRNSHVSHIFDVKFDVARIVSTSHDQKIVVLDFSEDLDTSLFI